MVDSQPRRQSTEFLAHRARYLRIARDAVRRPADVTQVIMESPDEGAARRAVAQLLRCSESDARIVTDMKWSDLSITARAAIEDELAEIEKVLGSV
jgi:DNA gyrase/topoisomerase IV subunit A